VGLIAITPVVVIVVGDRVIPAPPVREVIPLLPPIDVIVRQFPPAASQY
jgi:hypothetical protein